MPASRAISSDLRETVIEFYVSGLSRHEISDKTGVLTGSVTDVVEAERNNTLDINTLREASSARVLFVAETCNGASKFGKARRFLHSTPDLLCQVKEDSCNLLGLLSTSARSALHPEMIVWST